MLVYTLVLLGGYEHKRMKMNNELNMSPTNSLNTSKESG
jgi:hypothetical protein